MCKYSYYSQTGVVPRSSLHEAVQVFFKCDIENDITSSWGLKGASQGHWKEGKTQWWSHRQFTEMLSPLGWRLCSCLNAALGLVAMGTEKCTNKKMMYDVGGRPAGEQDTQPEWVCVRARLRASNKGCNRHKVQQFDVCGRSQTQTHVPRGVE